MNLSQSKVKELEDQNALLQANLAKVKDERDQLVKVSRHIKVSAMLIIASCINQVKVSERSKTEVIQ